MQIYNNNIIVTEQLRESISWYNGNHRRQYLLALKLNEH